MKQRVDQRDQKPALTKVLAHALKRHPAVLVFPGWEVPLESAAWRDARRVRAASAGGYSVSRYPGDSTILEGQEGLQ